MGSLAAAAINNFSRQVVGLGQETVKNDASFAHTCPMEFHSNRRVS